MKVLYSKELTWKHPQHFFPENQELFFQSNSSEEKLKVVFFITRIMMKENNSYTQFGI